MDAFGVLQAGGRGVISALAALPSDQGSLSDKTAHTQRAAHAKDTTGGSETAQEVRR